MDRYTYTPNLLLNKRLTPPLSPSGRNPSLHPRIISHISRYTKERKRERGMGRKRGKGQRGGGVDGVKMYGVVAQCSWEAKALGGAMHDKTEIRGSYAIMYMCKNTLTLARTHRHTKKKVRIRTKRMKTGKDWF